jgi:CRISPR type III-A-associated RAMP protein Csm5
MGGNRPTFDVFKAISVRDTELIEGGLRVERIDTLSELRDGKKKRKDWKTFAECLKPETRLRTTITIDRGLLRDYSTAHEWSNAQTNITINRLWEALREFSSDVVEDEIRYYHNVGDVRGLYDGENDGLRKLIAEMDASQCAFSIGFGSGWLRLTVGRLLRERSNEHQWQTIRSKLGLANNRLDFDFPKSRKNWVDYDPDDGEWYSYNPLGWVRAVYTQR